MKVTHAFGSKSPVWPEKSLVGAALAFAFVFAATPAEARKECRTLEPPEVAEEDDEAAADGWPHDVQYGWHHASDEKGWVHDGPDDDDAPWVDDTDGSWVHETDYGWWASIPNAGLQDQADGEPAGDAGPEQDCTVSRERNECVVLANQIARYTFQLALAEEREDERWKESLEQTIERLEARGERFSCPWVEPSLEEKLKQTLAAVADAAVVAAQVAAKLYRLGLF